VTAGVTSSVRNSATSVAVTLRPARRDHPVLSLLPRLGLGAGEVAAMVKEDLDSRLRERVVRGLSRRRVMRQVDWTR
jgi:hypothetical protein